MRWPDETGRFIGQRTCCETLYYFFYNITKKISENASHSICKLEGEAIQLKRSLIRNPITTENRWNLQRLPLSREANTINI